MADNVIIEERVKVCPKCARPKGVADFYVCRGAHDGLQGWCKVCQGGNHQLPDGKAAQRNGHYKRKFGITLQDFNEMNERQGGLCAICRRLPGKRSLHVDHDHITGEVRGLLCYNCNRALGDLREDPVLIRAAIRYLEGGGSHRR